MSTAVTITVTIDGMEPVQEQLGAFRQALADRQPLHTEIAKTAAAFTRKYMMDDARHATAQRLGANPSGYRARASKSVEQDADGEMATVLIPRRTGYGRAFHDVTLRPGSGRTYLTIPAGPETYGRGVRSFPQDAFRPMIWGRFRALVWKAAGGRHEMGDVAYWLKPEVKQKQDRSLLPSDAGYAEVGHGAAKRFFKQLLYGASTGMPST